MCKSEDTWRSQGLHIQLCLEMPFKVHVWEATSTADEGRNQQFPSVPSPNKTAHWLKPQT